MAEEEESQQMLFDHFEHGYLQQEVQADVFTECTNMLVN
jgi:hypothetical protein